jgi:ATP-dependent RNA helicase RhlE
VNFEQLSLDPRLVAGTKHAGYETPTPIQQQAIPVVLQDRDVLGLAQTGTGKTAAFVLPILNRLLTGRLGKIRALILAPTRELADQIHQTILQLAKRTRIRSTTIYGGVSKGPQIGALRRGVEIVVACPGRLLDHIGEGNIDLSNVEVLVLDEADRMCDMGFLPDIRRVLKHVPTERQTLFFSATMPEEIRSLADSILTDPATVQVDMIAPAKTVSHALYPAPEGLKTRLLLSMLPQLPSRRVLVFTRTKRRARNLARDLVENGYRASALQGNMAQNARTAAINGFRNGEYDILVATDIAARGIDVSEISHVINYDMPDTVDAYTHRIGRTGRAAQTGEAFTFVVRDDLLAVRAIEKVLGAPIERRMLPGFDYGDFTFDPPPAQPKRQPYRTRPYRETARPNGAPANGSNGNGSHQNGNGRSANGSAPQTSPRTTPQVTPRGAPAGSQTHSQPVAATSGPDGVRSNGAGTNVADPARRSQRPRRPWRRSQA